MAVLIYIGECILLVVFIFISRLILQKITRLAVQGLAEGGQGREAHGLRLACLEDRQARRRQIGRAHV